MPPLNLNDGKVKQIPLLTRASSFLSIGGKLTPTKQAYKKGDRYQRRRCLQGEREVGKFNSIWWQRLSYLLTWLGLLQASQQQVLQRLSRVDRPSNIPLVVASARAR